MPNIGPLEIFIILVFWILPSYLVARYAERKGHSFAGYLILGLVIGWLISLIVALIAPDRTESHPVSVDRLGELQKLTELKNAGTLSSDEFEVEKARILSQS
jgi:hypothetical protein